MKRSFRFQLMSLLWRIGGCVVHPTLPTQHTGRLFCCSVAASAPAFSLPALAFTFDMQQPLKKRMNRRPSGKKRTLHSRSPYSLQSSSSGWISSTTSSDSLSNDLDSSSAAAATNVPKTTRYTIDDSLCPPTRAHVLKAAVSKACAGLDTYQSKKPLADHTANAYDVLVLQMRRSPAFSSSSSSAAASPISTRPVILDSGCGTGRSTRHLATLYPDHWVIGVDRSFVRLTRNNKKCHNSDDEEEEKEEDMALESSSLAPPSERPYSQQIAVNAFLVRAELVDFWRCCQRERERDSCAWNITHHYLLYPNPYPTLQRLTQRWYAHPSFPLLLKMGAGQLVVRSNWEGYLKEFAMAVELAQEFYNQENSGQDEASGSKRANPALPYLESARKGPVQRMEKNVPWTNFEAKYDRVGERTFELRLDYGKRIL